ncbi:MAG: SUMF1/EgtB/PvdO family nonheme iron enzyme [Deltaproteobacteria bacterium]|nr:SUMF1/EgtB/PvdO family nonheme iron enzyme [Deltaproteobacteria bacterium]
MVLSGAVLAVVLVACTRSEPVGTSTLSQGTFASKLEKPEVAAKVVTTPPPAVTAELEGKKASAPSPNGACPAGMALVEGDYCPDVEQTCLEWMDPPSSRYANFRCKRYAKPATCKGERVHMRYCIDITERVEEGSNLPKHFMSWTSSKKLCEAEGGRLCRESEWIFACEGEEMRPYPYGWERDSSACNVDITSDIGRVGRLVDHRAPAGANPKCASPFGVQDMAGNVEEWTQADGPGQGSKMGWKEVLKGSWWIPSRHACRQFQVGHNDVYNGAETGTRCCKDTPR